MSYHIRQMCPEDIAQVSQIDHEAFPTMIPPVNYHNELKNRLAHYIILYDDSIPTITPPLTNLPLNIVSSIMNGLRRYRGQLPNPTSHQSPSSNHYILGFAGTWIIANEAHIINIAVRQSYRHHGIGELLLMALIEMTPGHHAGMITVEVRASNTSAQQL